MITISNKASSMSKKMKPRVNNFQMTTEFVVLGVDGINTMLGEYSLVFQDTPDNIETLDETLSVLNGTTQFEWNPYITFLPLSTAKRFICSEWDTDYEAPGKSTLTATFEEQPIL